MKLYWRADVYGWVMTGLVGKGGAWFIGFSRRPVIPHLNADGSVTAQAGIAVDTVCIGGAQYLRKPWEKTSWTCAMAQVTPEGVRCPASGRCADCFGTVDSQ